MTELTPIWRTPSRDQAREVLVVSRARTEALVSELTDAQMKLKTKVGGGAWSAKDLLGHLAGYEEQAVALITGTEPRFAYGRYRSVDERNAADVARKRDWSVKRVRDDLATWRRGLVEAIDDIDDDRWRGKIQTASGRSALALVVGKLLGGGRHGLFAHDLAHVRDLEGSVRELTGTAR